MMSFILFAASVASNPYPVPHVIATPVHGGPAIGQVEVAMRNMCAKKEWREVIRKAGGSCKGVK